MGKKSSAPAQPTTTTNMGQFGSTTTGSFGSTWKPTEWQSGFINNSQSLMSNAQNALLNPSLSEQRINDLNRTTNLNFQNNMLNPALSRGLLRGSTAQDIYSVGQQNYANAYQQALDVEEARNNQRLANALGNYTTMYDMAKGVTGLSQSANQLASNYALSQAQMDAANNQNLYGLISQGMGLAGDISNAAGQAGSYAALFSDKRLKENIKKLDEVNGYNIYEFNFIGNPERQVGVIAQEIIDKCSDCVLLGADGYYKVNYSKLPQEVQKRIEELK